MGTKIRLQKDRRALVLCVVDVWDFDGSLPRMALKSLLPPDFDLATSDPAALGFKLMVAVNKFDLLPSQATATRVEQWVRLRIKQAGLPKPEKVFMVSGAGGCVCVCLMAPLVWLAWWQGISCVSCILHCG